MRIFSIQQTLIHLHLQPGHPGEAGNPGGAGEKVSFGL